MNVWIKWPILTGAFRGISKNCVYAGESQRKFYEMKEENNMEPESKEKEEEVVDMDEVSESEDDTDIDEEDDEEPDSEIVEE